MATLAKELAARGIRLHDPYKEHIEKAQEAGVAFEDLEEAEDHHYSDDDQSEKSEATAYTDTEEESKQQVSFATMPSKKASIASPSAMKKAPPRKLATITGAIGAPIANGIAAPIIRGDFLSRDPVTRKRYNNYHIRMLWHSYVTADDIYFEWIDKHTLKVVVYDPAWWADPAYQAAFDPEHGKESNLIESMIDFQEDRMEKVANQDKKRTGNTGYFVFGEAMSIKKEDDTAVFPTAMLHASINGVYIVIKVRVAHDDKPEEERTPRKAKAMAKSVSVGTGKNFANVRQRDDDAMDTGGGEQEEEKQNRPPAKNRKYKSPRSSTQQPLLGPSAPIIPPIVAFPQDNLQIEATGAASASKSVISDGWSVDTPPMDSIEIEKTPQQEEDIIDDNRDLPNGF